MRTLAAGSVQLLYVAPERLVMDGFLERLQRAAPAFFAVDEAHCISQWGHDFRPEYRQLRALRGAFSGVAVHAYTATATPQVREDIVAELRLQHPTVLVGSFDRPNLIYRVRPRTDRVAQVMAAINRHRGQAGIVYCIRRSEVDELTAALTRRGVRALRYHAGLADDERRANQEAFVAERVDVVVATVAFGMGIDRSDVRFVVHAGAPRSLEHYQQESGRAGRDGLEAECVLIYSGADFLKWRVMLERNGELTDATRATLRDMERYASGVRCRHRHLVEYFGERYERDRCGACDYCLEELEAAAEPIVLARKILSCVARVGQRFGAAHVTNVLRGSESDQISARRHDQLSTFGLLKDMSVPEVRGYIEQLSGNGLLRQTDSEFPVLELTDAGVALLKDANAQPGLVLARQRRPTKDRTPKRARGVEAESWQDVDRDLFERLRGVRLEIARARGVPPYVIFHDTTLRDMARLKPTTMEALRQVKGVGERKAADLGERFLAEIRGSD
jgi:ATP-dependent DNA helicase RecQ